MSCLLCPKSFGNNNIVLYQCCMCILSFKIYCIPYTYYVRIRTHATHVASQPKVTWIQHNSLNGIKQTNRINYTNFGGREEQVTVNRKITGGTCGRGGFVAILEHLLNPPPREKVPCKINHLTHVGKTLTSSQSFFAYLTIMITIVLMPADISEILGVTCYFL